MEVNRLLQREHGFLLQTDGRRHRSARRLHSTNAPPSQELPSFGSPHSFTSRHNRLQTFQLALFSFWFPATIVFIISACTTTALHPSSSRNNANQSRRLGECRLPQGAVPGALPSRQQRRRAEHPGQERRRGLSQDPGSRSVLGVCSVRLRSAFLCHQLSRFLSFFGSLCFSFFDRHRRVCCLRLYLGACFSNRR